MISREQNSDPVLARRSIRKYTDQPVSDESLRKLLEAAMAAPSAGDERPWHFVTIRDTQVRGCIPRIHPYADMVSQAQVAILVCGDESLQKQKGFWVQDCAAATENILIEAQQLSLGAVWLGIYPVQGRVEAFRVLLGLEHDADEPVDPGSDLDAAREADVRCTGAPSF